MKYLAAWNYSEVKGDFRGFRITVIAFEWWCAFWNTFRLTLLVSWYRLCSLVVNSKSGFISSMSITWNAQTGCRRLSLEQKFWACTSVSEKTFMSCCHRRHPSGMTAPPEIFGSVILHSAFTDWRRTCNCLYLWVSRSQVWFQCTLPRKNWWNTESLNVNSSILKYLHWNSIINKPEELSLTVFIPVS